MRKTCACGRYQGIKHLRIGTRAIDAGKLVLKSSCYARRAYRLPIGVPRPKLRGDERLLVEDSTNLPPRAMAQEKMDLIAII